MNYHCNIAKTLCFNSPNNLYINSTKKQLSEHETNLIKPNYQKLKLAQAFYHELKFQKCMCIFILDDCLVRQIASLLAEGIKYRKMNTRKLQCPITNSI